MSGYTKLFETILDSSVWFESPATRLVWITLLAMKNRNGVVAASVMGVAHRARVTLEEAKTALEKFQSPDPFSRTKDFDGRRIEEVDGGWKILNHAKYRDMLRSADRTEYMRLKQAEHRERVKSKPAIPFTPPTLDEVKLHCAKIGLPESEALRFIGYYESNGWKVSRNPMRSWHGAMATWKANWEERRGSGKPNAVAHESPPWQQLKAVESLLQDCDKKLKQITVPNHELFPEDYKKACALRTPIVEEKHRLAEQKRELTKLVASNGQKP